MATPETIDDVFSALGRFVRIRSRSVQASAKADDGGAETAAKRALFVLRQGPIRPGELAAAMSADPSTTSRHVARLVDDGLVRREPDPADGRACRLQLTDDGFARVAELAARRRAAIGELVAQWPDDDFATFAELLTRFVDAVEAYSVHKDAKGDDQ